MTNFQSLEVVDRDSETQPEVVETLNRSSRIRVNMSPAALLVTLAQECDGVFQTEHPDVCNLLLLT